MEITLETKTLHTYTLTLDSEEAIDLLDELATNFADDLITEEADPALTKLYYALKDKAYRAGGIINPTDNNIYINHDHNCTHHPYRFSGWERLDNTTEDK